MKKMIPHELPGTIFMQPWWLDIVNPGNWEDITIEKGGKLYARWPIVKKKIKGFSHIHMPVLTQKMGPWILQTSDKQEALHRNERKMLNELIEKLPEFDYMTYNLDLSIKNYLPFIWKGFTQRSVTSFQIQWPYDIDNVWENLKSSVRRDIRRAKEELSVEQIENFTELYDLVLLTFSRHGKKPPYSESLLKKLCEAAVKRGRASGLKVVDKDSSIHAALLIIHDDHESYYLVGGMDPNSKIPGAVSLGLWEGVQLAYKLNNTFDFEGSSIEPIESFFSSFGAKPIHFHNIQAMSKKYAAIHYGKKLYQRIFNKK